MNHAARRRRATAVALIVAIAGPAFAGPAPARAATISLDSCSGTGFDVLALWSAILDANDESTHPGADTIRLAPGCTYTIAGPYPGTSFALPPITSSVSISGRHGAIVTVPTATEQFGLFDVRAGAGLVASDLTLTNHIGHQSGSYVANAGTVLLDSLTLDGRFDTIAGPAIVNKAGASLSILDSVVKNMFHNASVALGGAIDNLGTLYVVGSTLLDNNVHRVVDLSVVSRSIGNSGHMELIDSRVLVNNPPGQTTKAGGIDNRGTLIIRGTTIQGHRYTTSGAAISNMGTLHVENSGFENNDGFVDAAQGGALYNGRFATIVSSTFIGNNSVAGGIYNLGLTRITHSTLFDGIVNNPFGGMALAGSILMACSGAFDDQGSNLTTSAASGCPGAVGDPKLKRWSYVGSHGPLYALGPGSAALDAAGTVCPATDQRGFARPGGGACDIGAYENQPPSTPTGLVLSQGANPSSTGILAFDWGNATDPDQDTLTYRLTGRDFDDSAATQLYAGSESSASFSSLPEGTYQLRVEAFDGSASSGSATLSGIVVDRGAPSSPAASADRTPDFVATDGTGWYRDQVDIAFGGATDPLLADGSAPSGVSSTTPTQTLSTSGQHVLTGTATDGAGNVSPSTVATFNVDADAPLVEFGACPAAAILGSDAAVSWAAADLHSGLTTSASGAFEVDTTTVGPRTFAASATDNVGLSSESICSFSVVYDFTGYFRPVGNAPAVNKASAGNVVPVSFSLGGDQGLGVIAAGFPVSTEVSCATTELVTTGQPTVSAAPGLVYGGGRYTYQWKTQKAWAGTCRQFVILLADGTYHHANFAFR